MGLGLGLTHFVPPLIYAGFLIMSIAALAGKARVAFYYMVPFLPYRVLRDTMAGFPLGGNALTILLLAIILGALIHGKKLPKSNLYATWVVISIYSYLSLWVGVLLSNAPIPLWLADINFVTWKDYIVIPLIFVAASLVIEDRNSIKITIILTGITLLLIDRSCILEQVSRSWAKFDESKRDAGPLSFGSNQTAAFLAQYAMFYWGLAQYVKKIRYKMPVYALVGITIFATLYTFSRGAYLSLIISIFLLGVLKDRKLLIILGVFLLTWQAVVPTPVRERIMMTENSNGKLEASAQERVDLWKAAENSFLHSPLVGDGFATFQLGGHVDNLKDTHNFYVKVLVETGLVGFFLYCVLFQQMWVVAYRLFRRASDPLYMGLGLGLILTICSTIISNGFGDRWTYIEITGLLWVLIAAGLRALKLMETGVKNRDEDAIVAAVNPYIAYR